MAVLTLLVVLAAWRWLLRDGTPALKPDASDHAPLSTQRPSPGDPRVTLATPYRNVRPEVKYVGDQACARCHLGLARSYRQHPMGRALVAVGGPGSLEQEEAAPKADFRASGFRYFVERRGERVFHRETKEDPQRRVIAEMEAEVHFVVGSGTRGRSYLINRDGYLFQSPITWYPQKGIWDLSPGYAVRHHHFARPVPAECLFCHSNHADAVEETLNRYRPPIFEGFAIGCERCHGPGELHVQRRSRDEQFAGVDYTIVNPRHLAPALREAVCEQCHLQGEVRVLRRGRKTFDYRPGLPLHLFLSVFVKPATPTDSKKFVGHVEQMHVSRCFKASAGKMGCISCHDPHELPDAAHRVSHYRDRCLRCHGEKSCGLSPVVRRQQNQDDSCIHCHMPAGKSDIAHTSITDHRVPRRVEESPPSAPSRVRPLPGEMSLVHFHQDVVAPEDKDVSRDLGVALMDRVERYPEPVRKRLGQMALPWLEAASQADDGDLPAWDAKANALWAQGRIEEAAAAFETVLAKAPSREVTLHSAATLAMERDQPDAARAFWERALRVNPWRYEFHYGLAAALAQLRQLQDAIRECQRALELNPANLEVRKLLVRCYVDAGEKDEARTQFELLLAFKPPNEEALRRWFFERQK